MNSYVFSTAIVIAVLAFIESGDALQCWECSSDAEGICGYRFNASTQYPGSSSSIIYNLQQNSAPRLNDCDRPNPQSGYGNYGYQRHVCMKRVETDKRYRRTTYTRGCHLLTGDESVGTCPTRYSSYGDVTVDFCEYCDTHQCNGVQGLQKSAFWMGLIPIALALVLRK